MLGHEIIHVTEKHTIRAIQKGKLVQMGATETVAGNNVLMSKLADKAYEVIESGFGRGEELEADEKGIVLANAVGYAPQGMNGFLTMLVERNKTGQPARNGLFASHPETQERMDKMTRQIASAKLSSTATVAERYTSTITFQAGSRRRDRDHRGRIGRRRGEHGQAGRGAEEEGPGRPGRSASSQRR